MLSEVLVIFATLLGFSALVSFLVNTGKFFGIVKDGDADKWVAGLNLIGVLALYAVKLFIPDFDPVPIDAAMQEIAAVGVFIFGYLSMIFGSRVTYGLTKGLPIVGKSFSAAKETKILK
jgi:hypothetical protein